MDRIRGLPAILIELALGLKQPTVTALYPGDDLLGVELVIRLMLAVGVLLSIAFGRQLARQPRPPALLSRQLRRQLVPARIAMLFVLGLIGRDRLGDDLPRDLP